MITLARQRHPELHFVEADAEDYHFTEKFDYILLSDLVGSLWDVQKVFENMRNASHDRTRIIISNYNYLWEPLIQMGERLGFKQKQPLQNWLSVTDIRSILTLAGFETIRTEKKIIFPKECAAVVMAFQPLCRQFTHFQRHRSHKFYHSPTCRGKKRFPFGDPCCSGTE